MIVYNIWIWVVVGIIPYSIACQRSRNMRRLRIQALFWSVERVADPRGWSQWTVCVPLIERFRSVVHTTLMCLKGAMQHESE